jgi:LytTr DNA-binding domain
MLSETMAPYAHRAAVILAWWLVCLPSLAQSSVSSGTTPFIFDGNRMYAELSFIRPDGSIHKALAFVDMGSAAFAVTGALFKELQLDRRPLMLKVGGMPVSISAAEIVLETLRSAAEQGPYPQRFLTRQGNTASVVSVSDIEWIEAADYYACLHAKGKKHLLRESIAALEAKLNPAKFVRLHRSAIVNIDHVREIHRDGRTEGWVLLSTRERVRLNKTGWGN